LAQSRFEVTQLTEAALALRAQLDAATAAADIRIAEARTSAAAEIHQLRATCEALRSLLEANGTGKGARAPSPARRKQKPHSGEQASDGR